MSALIDKIVFTNRLPILSKKANAELCSIDATKRLQVRMIGVVYVIYTTFLATLKALPANHNKRMQVMFEAQKRTDLVLAAVGVVLW